MRYFIIAGEASGDLPGARLMKELKNQDRKAEFFFFGGPLMQTEGGTMILHYQQMAFMGAIDVLLNIGRIKANYLLCKKQLFNIRPDVLILIDYPGFNLKIAEYAHRNQIPVIYYILPKVWAWKEWRIKKLRSYTNALFSILPFEKEFFAKHGVEVSFVGNPLIDLIEESKKHFRTRIEFLHDNHLPDNPLVALLPGSRSQEIRNMLPVMTRIAADFPEFRFVIAGIEAVDPSLYEKYSCNPQVPVLYGQTYELVYHAHAALVTSGTATLETALLGTPQVVLYKMAGGKAGYQLFRTLFLKVRYISLPNLILNQEAVSEFVMDQMKYMTVLPETVRLLRDEDYRNRISGMYSLMKAKLGEKGAAARAASEITAILNKCSLNR